MTKKKIHVYYGHPMEDCKKSEHTKSVLEVVDVVTEVLPNHVPHIPETWQHEKGGMWSVDMRYLRKSDIIVADLRKYPTKKCYGTIQEIGISLYTNKRAYIILPTKEEYKKRLITHPFTKNAFLCTDLDHLKATLMEQLGGEQV